MVLGIGSWPAMALDRWGFDPFTPGSAAISEARSWEIGPNVPEILMVYQNHQNRNGHKFDEIRYNYDGMSVQPIFG